MIFFILYTSIISAWDINFIDLSDVETTSNWYLIGTSDQANIQQICNLSIIILNNEMKIYRTFLTSQDVTRMKFEADLYISNPSDFTFTIFVNEQEYSQKKYYASQIKLFPTLCESNPDISFIQFEDIIDFQTQGFDSISILFQSQNSILGLRNILLYTDGITLDCPPGQVMGILQTCVNSCDAQLYQLKTPQLTNCHKQNTGINVALMRTYPDAMTLIRYNIADNVWTSDSFKINGAYQEIFIEKLGFGLTSFKIQQTGAMYIIGDWEPGSFVRFRLKYTTPSQTIKSTPTATEPSQNVESQFYFGNQVFFENITKTTITCDQGICSQIQITFTYINYDLITINKTNLRFEQNSLSLFDVYQTQLTLLNGTTIKVNKVLLNSEALILANHPSLTFSIQYYIKGNDAYFAFQNKLILYKASRGDSACTTYQSLLVCVNCRSLEGLFLHMGKCIEECPVHSVKYIIGTTYNCTDLINIETLQYTPNLAQNSSGVYLIKEFYNRNFDTNFIKQIFDSYPTYSSELYTNIQNNKIVGGFATWGYGSFIKTFNDLPYHYQIRLYCRIYFIDSWTIEDKFIIYIDDQKYEYNIQDLSDEIIQGKQIFDHKLDITIKQTHYEESVTIKFQCLGEDYNDSSDKSCGMNNLFIIYDRNVNYVCPQKLEYFNQYSEVCSQCQNAPTGCIQHHNIKYYKCDYHCFTCQDLPTICLTCDPALRRTFNNNQCPCIDGYYEIDQQPQCKKCQPQCLRCDKDQCFQCNSDRNLVNGICVCLDGYTEVNGNCEIICNIKCQTCYGFTDKQCLSCDDQQYRTFVNNECQCKDGFRENEFGICEKICTNQLCSKCNVNDECYECKIELYRTLNSLNGCVCMSNYYEDQNNICQPICHNSCLTCSQPLSAADCLSCDQNSHRYLEYDQSCSCIDGYEDVDEGCEEIQNCHYTCNLCYESNNSAQCVNCKQNRDFNENDECICQQGYEEVNLNCEIIQDQNQGGGDQQNDQENGDEQNQDGGDEQNQDGGDEQNQDGGNQGDEDEQNQNDEDEQHQEDEQNQNEEEVQQEEQQNNTENETKTEYHECNDGNQLPRDGCFDYLIEAGWFCSAQTENQYSICQRCENQCQYCNSSGLCKICADGYFLNSGHCIACKSQCKTCTDSSDNCLACSDSTQTPINGFCKTCDKGFYLVNNQCISKCGDGIVVDSEQCDDANNYDLDGCDSKCQIEKDYECQNLYCNPKPPPSKVANLFTNNQITVEILNFKSICSELRIKIDQMSESNYQFNISQVEFTHNKLKCQIDFKFYNDIKPHNIIHVFVRKSSRLLKDDDEIELTIQPKKQYYFSPKQQEQSKILFELYQVLIYFVIGMIPISIIFKEFDKLYLDFILGLQYLQLFNSDFSLYLSDILSINIWSLLYLDFPLQINQDNFQNYKLNILKKDHFIISNIWTSLIFITTVVIIKKLIYLVKLRQDRILTTQIRPTSSKNTQQFTFRFEKALQKVTQYPQEERQIKFKIILIYLKKMSHKIIDIFQYDITYSIFIQLFFITNISQNLVYTIFNFILLLFCILLWIKYMINVYRLMNENQKILYYYFNQAITKGIFILSLIIFETSQWQTSFLCFIIFTISILCNFWICQDFKYKDVFFTFILLGITYIQYQNQMMMYLDYGIIGSIFIFILGNIIYVTYNIIRHYI